MVVLPDYQGIGIGTAFENYTSQIYADKGWRVNVTTTTPALVHALVKSDRWSLFRAGRQKSTWDNTTAARYRKGAKQMAALGKSKSNNRVTYSFNYIPLSSQP